MNCRPAAVVIVDGYSTGKFFAAKIRARGLACLHLAGDTQKNSDIFAQVAAHSHADPDLYDLMMDWTGDPATTAGLFHAYDIRAVLAGCESGVVIADALATHLGTPANDPATSAIRRDKFLMQEAMTRAGLRSLASFRSTDREAILAWANDRQHWPVVLKPLRGTGTEGVAICQDDTDLETALDRLTITKTILGEPNREVVVQEHASGVEYAVNTVSRDGRHVLTELWEYGKVLTVGNSPVYDYVRLLPHPRGRLAVLRDYAFKVLDAVGLRHGPAHVEIMLGPDGPVLIEIGARVMGGSFDPAMIAESIGQDQLEATLDAYLKPEKFLAEADHAYEIKKHLLIKFIISSRSGAIREIPGLYFLAGLPSAHGGDFLGVIESGRVERTLDLFSSPGKVFFFHADEKTVWADYQAVRQLEMEAEESLFEIEEEDRPANWFEILPDELWLKPESEGFGDAAIIAQALELAPGHEVLDCPCGDGRVARHLIEMGLKLTGVDLNERFVARAREQLGGMAEFHRMDMRRLSFGPKFDAVCNWFNSFGYFSEAEDLDVLRRLAAALKPGGRILIEAPNRRHILANLTPKVHEGQALEVAWNPKTEQVETEVQSPEGSIRVAVRMYSLGQMKILFRCAGLEFLAVYGENLKEFGPDCARMILVARKP